MNEQRAFGRSVSRYLIALTSWLFLPLFAAQAAVFTVNTNVDVPDANPGDGVCDAVPLKNVCTLRAAIEEANALPGSDEIILPSLPPPNAYVLTIVTALTITSNLTITGGGAANTIIDGNKIQRFDSGVLRINGGITVSLSGVTIRNGAKGVAGVVSHGGGIHNGGTLTLTDSTVSGNSANNGDGGGINNGGTLTLTNSTVSGNNTISRGGGIYNRGGVLTLIGSTVSGNNARNGGGIANDGSGTMTLIGSTVSGNNAGIDDGGGIHNDGGVGILTNSTVSGNSAGVDGGGVMNIGGGMTLTNSTVSGNNAARDGGGIVTGPTLAGGTMTLTNSTVSGNNAARDGGGILTTFGAVTSSNTTITDNLADADLSFNGVGGGVYVGPGTTFNFQNTIIAENSILAFNPVSPKVPSDCVGIINSLGNNLMRTLDGCTVNGVAVTLSDPLLGPLQNNGGPTQTHALLTTSPAINSGNAGGCRDQFGVLLTSDQRGFPRPSNGTLCDIGSYELFAIACPGDSLQAAINAASAGDTIAVTGTCNENILVRNEKQRISIDGLGLATINGPSAGSPTLNIRGKGILIQGFAITGGSNGVHINRGSNSVITSNIIAETGGNGILIDELAFAVVVNNVIGENPGAGIFVSENSTARIGFNSDSETSANGNFIGFNALGVVVSNGSSARIIANTIQENTGVGVQVLRDSHADIASNTIIDNGHGIELGENSLVQLGENAGSSIYELANSGTNIGFGIRCTRGSLADGRIGSLSGGSGAKSFSDGSCTDNLSP